MLLQHEESIAIISLVREIFGIKAIGLMDLILKLVEILWVFYHKNAI